LEKLEHVINKFAFHENTIKQNTLNLNVLKKQYEGFE